MRPTPRTVVTVGFVSALLVPTAAQTFTLLSPARHWGSVPVAICVRDGHVSLTANDPDRGITAVVQALNGTLPSLPGTGWNFTAVGPVVTAQPCDTPWQLGDGQPTISLVEKIKGTCTGSCLAATFTGFYSCPQGFHPGDTHCRIDDSDVEGRANKTSRNGGPYDSEYETGCTGGEYSIEGIMVHEAGHQLGLGHTNVGGATMYPSVSSCDNGPATIAPDDTAGLDALY